jgi:hypothetical protein
MNQKGVAGLKALENLLSPVPPKNSAAPIPATVAPGPSK